MPSQKKDNPLVNITAHLAAGLPMVLYRRPLEEKVNCVLQNNSQLNFLENYNQKGFVFAPFNAEANSTVLIQPDRFFEYVPISSENPGDGKELVINEDTEFHLELVAKGVKQIKTGRLKKVIASRSIQVGVSIAPLEIFHRILNNYTNAYCYYFFHPKIGTWLGASPELLISVNDLKFETSSLAGTTLAKENEIPKWTPKELEEQEIVTRYIENGLKNLHIPLAIAERVNQRAGKLWHLKSVLKGKLNSFEQLKTVIDVLHPTPAVCGFPKQEAMEFILSEENYNRSFYTGFLGELNLERKKTAKFFVNLRCMQVLDGIAKIYVGGGITVDSVAQSELKETISKSRTMLDLL